MNNPTHKVTGNYTHFEPLAFVLPSDLDQPLRKLDDVRKNDLTPELGVPDAAREDKRYQTNAGFNAR